MIRTHIGATLAIAIVTAASTVGCNGRTIEAERTQETSPDGRVATQTQTRTREVVKPATQATTPPDARQPDPSMP